MNQSDYQHMTNLPEELERSLLDVPATALLRLTKKLRGIVGASEKYTLVKCVAEEMEEKEIRAFVNQKHDGTEALSILEAPKAAPASAPVQERPERAPPVKVFDSTIVELAQGTTTIQPGSLRDKVLGHLRAIHGNKCSVSELQGAMEREGHHFEVKPVVAKLRAAGWVK